MPRHNNRRAQDTGLDPDRARRGVERVVTSADGAWLVRNVTADGAVKTYRCPGCDHEIRPGTAHVVAWPADERGDLADRRHWHTGCWNTRGRHTRH